MDFVSEMQNESTVAGDPAVGWPVVPAQAVTDVVYGAIRDRILRGELAPGTVLRQEEISRAMGVSRTPVREGLMRLVSDGYVQRLHRRGFRVAGEPIRDLVLLYPILAALERLACASALPGLNAAHIGRLDRINAGIRQAVDRGDAKEAISLNQTFHRTLCEPCDNPRLVHLLDDLSSEVMRLEIWSFSNETDREQTIRNHDDIIAALRRRDVEHVLTTLERDRLSAYTAYREQLADVAE
jgi:DNA-binding GntR family transcriptional regulator